MFVPIVCCSFLITPALGHFEPAQKQNNEAYAWEQCIFFVYVSRPWQSWKTQDRCIKWFLYSEWQLPTSQIGKGSIRWIFVSLRKISRRLAWNGTGEFWNRYEAMERCCTTLVRMLESRSLLERLLFGPTCLGEAAGARPSIGFRFALHCDRRDAAQDIITPCFGKWACCFSACALIMGLTPPGSNHTFFVVIRVSRTTPRKKTAANGHSAIQGFETKIVLPFSDYLASCSYSTRENLINDDTWEHGWMPSVVTTWWMDDQRFVGSFQAPKGASHQWWSRFFSSVVFFSPQEFW